MLAIKQPKEKTYQAFVDYVQAEQNRFYRLALSYVKERAAAMDIVQNAILNGLKAIHTLSEPQYVKTWFYRILVNACIDEVRRGRRLIPTDPQELPEGPQPLDGGPGRETLLDLQRALEALEPDDKTIVVLRYFEDMKFADIAEVLDLPLGAVKTKLYRALERLKLSMEGEVFKDE